MSKYLCADCVLKEQCDGEWTTNCASYKKEPFTNEEYLRSLNTEQLAEAIYYLTWFHTELDERLDKNVKNGRYNDDENIKIVVDWLKQPNVFE